MNKLKNNLLIKNIFILLVSGVLTKIFGMISKILYTRIAGIKIISLYTLIVPTLMLIISITQFSFPISISKLSAEGKYKDKKLLSNAYFIGIIINIISFITIILLSKTVANLLHNKSLYIPILSISFIIFFTTTSSIQRGFLHGKEDMLPTAASNVIEEIVKILLIIIVFPIVVLKGSIISVTFLILFNIIIELVSISIMSNVIERKYLKQDKSKYSIDKTIIKDILKISVPTTMTRLISGIGFFLEPIILTNILLKTGYNLNYITLEYGIINSYVIPLLSLPTFFSSIIASALLPNLTKIYKDKKINNFNNKLFKLMSLSLVIGLICLIFILAFPKQILNIIYSVNLGINYIYLIGPFFLIIYMQPALAAAMQAMDKTDKLFKISVISIITKYIVLTITGLLGFGINCLIFSMITGIIITTLLVLITVLKEINKKTKMVFISKT